MLKLRLLGAVGIVAVVGGVLFAQTPASPAFDVVSIKLRAPGGMPVAAGFFQTQPGGRFRGVGITARALISLAFRTADAPLLASQVVGGPDWIGTSQFDIVATTTKDISGDASSEELRVLVRALLEDRFTLKVHTEARPVPVYVLVKARGDGRLGPQLRQSVTDCAAVQQDRAATAPPTTMPSPTTGRPTCALRLVMGNLVAGSITMRGLAGAFTKSNVVDRPVLDRTDLVGTFDVDLQWAPERMPTDVSASATTASAVSSLPDGPSVFTAVQEQLGLKLERRDEPMDSVVVDHIEKPTPD